MSDQVRIGHKLLIGRIQGRRLDDRLSDENAVERIAVQQGKPGDQSRGLCADRYLGEPGIERGLGNLLRIKGKIAAAKPGFDRDLPNTGGAEQYLGVTGFD